VEHYNELHDVAHVYPPLTPCPHSRLFFFFPKKESPPSSCFERAIRLCVLKSSSGPSRWRRGVGRPGQPESGLVAGEKIKVATRTAHPSPLERRVNATLCTPHGSPTLTSAQDDATGAGNRVFNDLQTTRLFSCRSPMNKSPARE